MKIKIILIFYLLFITITGCELEVKNIKLPDFQQKLVINSFISPYDTISFVSVSSNEKIFGEMNNTESLGNLSVTISNGQGVINLKDIDERFIFRRKEMPVEEGKTYILKVTSDKGFSAEATCTVPIKRELYLEADTVWELSKYAWMPGVNFIRSKIYLTDPAGEADFFRFVCKELEYYPGVSYASVVASEKTEILNDIGKDGERIFVNTVSVTEPSVECDSVFMIFYILQTDKAYFTYHYSLENYSGGDDPFSEVSPAYSNINGGLGIFASYTVDSMVYRLK